MTTPADEGSDAADEPQAGTDYRSYEVYQRERVGDSTNLVSPRDLIADGYLADPFTVPGIMREHYPCYRDWIGNRFWVTRYDDVTSIFVDDANFESRPRSAVYGSMIAGTDLGGDPSVQQAIADRVEAFISQLADREVLTASDLVVDFVAPLARELAAAVLGVDLPVIDTLAPLVARLRRGAGWLDHDRFVGAQAFGEIVAMVDPLLAARRSDPTDDLLGAAAELGATGADVAMTLLELHDESLPASLGNLWCLLLTHPEQLAAVRAEPRLMKFAYLEALRHSPPVPTADRYARHEVERFGRLLPDGALLHLSAAAANRDPRQFGDPDRFDVGRKDLCQREPRGQYRADGLPSGIAFGYGKPSKLPAVPRDAPRSRYALARDVATAASLALLRARPDLALAPAAEPSMACHRLGGIYTCRSLPLR